MEIKNGTNGRIYWVDERGVATRATCAWLVQLPGYDEDGNVTVVDCGAPLVRLDDDGWECEAGHVHHTYGSAAWARKDAEEWAREDAARRGVRA
jgi:hypothetical protein